jgi:Zn-dependent metalloprotease
MTCPCLLIPPDVLERLARNPELSEDARSKLAQAAAFSRTPRALRSWVDLKSHQQISSYSLEEWSVDRQSVAVYDCGNTTALPGTHIPDPHTCDLLSAQRAFTTTHSVANFFQTIFGRHSVDNAGATLVAAVRYGAGNGQASWDGTRVLFGDGDGEAFLDFTYSPDVVCHEIMHGVTQYSARLNWFREAGGLDESLSDVFGVMFRQWLGQEDAKNANWTVGAEVIGPILRKQGVRCLRDLADPAGAHCAVQQLTHYSQYHSNLDVHYTSGIPNLAFYKAAVAIGGKSWEKAGLIWYHALTRFPAAPSLKIAAFATRTRLKAQELFSSDPRVFAAIDTAWSAVGL